MCPIPLYDPFFWEPPAPPPPVPPTPPPVQPCNLFPTNLGSEICKGANALKSWFAYSPIAGQPFAEQLPGGSLWDKNHGG